MCEARINVGTDHLIEQNREEFEGLLCRAMQPPPQKVCAGSVYIEHVIMYVLPVITALYYRLSLLHYILLLILMNVSGSWKVNFRSMNQIGIQAVQ